MLKEEGSKKKKRSGKGGVDGRRIPTKENGRRSNFDLQRLNVDARSTKLEARAAAVV